jgi:hypothetical protein
VTPNGASIVRSPTPGPAMFVNAWFKDTKGNPIVGAEVDVWHSSPEGFYENQDPGQAEMNLRGKFFTDQDGHIGFRSVRPAGYPIPIEGPVGELLRAQGRHNMRPAHLHFLASKDGFKTLISHASPARQLCAPRQRAGAGQGRQRPVVLARPHVRHGGGHLQTAAATDHGQGARRTAEAASARAHAGLVSTRQ